MKDYRKYLEGEDLGSIANVGKLLPIIKEQEDFDSLFTFLFSSERLLVMRTADAIEKITKNNPGFLKPHKKELLNFLKIAQEKGFKLHLALLVSRIDLTQKEIGIVWAKLTEWASNRKEGRIVRVNSLQTLFGLAKKTPELRMDFELTAQEIEKENIPSLNARIRKIKGKLQ